MEKGKAKKFLLKHIWDFALLFALVLGTASTFVARSIGNQKEEENALIATVYLDKQKMEINDEHGVNVNPFVLSTIHEEKHYVIAGKKNNLTIAVKNNSICVIEAECPGQECVHEGWVSHPNHPIICAHNGVFIEITSQNWEDVIIR